MYEVDPTSLKKVLKNFVVAYARSVGSVKEGTSESAKYLMNMAKSMAPMKTGTLKDSFKVEQVEGLKRDFKYSIINTAPYASFVEFGTGIRVDTSADKLATLPVRPPRTLITAKPRGKPKYPMHIKDENYPEYLWYTKGQYPQPFMGPLLVRSDIHEATLQLMSLKFMKNFFATYAL